MPGRNIGVGSRLLLTIQAQAACERQPRIASFQERLAQGKKTRSQGHVPRIAVERHAQRLVKAYEPAVQADLELLYLARRDLQSIVLERGVDPLATSRRGQR